VVFFIPRETAGEFGARHSLRPLISEGHYFWNDSGVLRRGNADSRQQHPSRRVALSDAPQDEVWLRGKNCRRGHLALQLSFMEVSESMGNHDSEIVDASSVD
jgi:hypothetical protein